MIHAILLPLQYPRNIPPPTARKSSSSNRPSIFFIVVLATILTSAKAFAGARNSNTPLGFFRAGSRFSGTMASSPQPQHDSATAFSAASRRLESPSAERNKDPIWGVLSTKVIPNLPRHESWTILETAAGAGVHTEFFASKLLENDNNFVWHATDPTKEALQSIAARVQEHSSLESVVAVPKKLTLDASGICQIESDDENPAPENPLDLVLCINMIHISPWEATLGLMKVAGSKLREPSSENDGGYLYCYGPYKQDGKIVPSNE